MSSIQRQRERMCTPNLVSSDWDAERTNIWLFNSVWFEREFQKYINMVPWHAHIRTLTHEAHTFGMATSLYRQWWKMVSAKAAFKIFLKTSHFTFTNGPQPKDEFKVKIVSNKHNVHVSKRIAYFRR